MRMNLLVALALLVPAQALAQVRVEVDIPVPTLTFVAPPPLVIVSPGIQVVEDHSDEVFFHSGVYWVRRDGHWFRSHDHRGGWVFVRPAIVPRPLVGIPAGKYKHWKKHKQKHAVPAGHKVKQRDYGKEDSRGRDDGHWKHGKPHKNGKHGKGGGKGKH